MKAIYEYLVSAKTYDELHEQLCQDLDRYASIHMWIIYGTFALYADQIAYNSLFLAKTSSDSQYQALHARFRLRSKSSALIPSFIYRYRLVCR